MKIFEMKRCLYAISDYLSRKDDSPRAARDIHQIADRLQLDFDLLWFFYRNLVGKRVITQSQDPNIATIEYRILLTVTQFQELEGMIMKEV